MRVELRFTVNGQKAIDNFENHEIIETFSRHMNTLTKKYMVITSVPLEANQNIASAGLLSVVLENNSPDVDIFFRELARDMKNPLNKRYVGKLDRIFKAKVILDESF